MVEHRTVNARGVGSSPAIQAIRMWYSGCAPDSKSGYVGSNPAVLANWRVEILGLALRVENVVELSSDIG